MFNGIINQIAIIDCVEKINPFNHKITIKLTKKLKSKVQLGDSISINGVCLTVEKIFDKNLLQFALAKETLALTNLSTLKAQDKVNLETALRFNQAINGHLISGHIDDLGKICAIESAQESYQYRIQFAAKFNPLIAQKGSIAVDGVSLTVNQVIDHQSEPSFAVGIIPFTFKHSLFSSYKIGTKVNLEFDLLARYIKRQLQYKN